MGRKTNTGGWTLTVPINIGTLFSLYNSIGDVTLAADIATTLDGPIQVVRGGAVTINTAITTTNRCRGLVTLFDSLTMGASGSLSMTARGAAGNKSWAHQDILIPSFIVLSGKHTSPREFLAWIRKTGYFICDPSLYACPPPGMGDVTADYAAWPGRGTVIISASGCGAGGSGVFYYVSNGNFGASGGAGTGLAGTNAPGGGGSGAASAYSSAGVTTAVGGNGGKGCVWSGGPGGGSGAAGYNSSFAGGKKGDDYGGLGGEGHGVGGTYTGAYGVGNPGMTMSGTTTPGGTGGVLVCIVKGDVTLNTGHALSAKGVASGNPGGSSGGGFAGLFYSGALTGAPNLSASGGANTGAGGAGGAGATQSKTFATMGW